MSSENIDTKINGSIYGFHSDNVTGGIKTNCAEQNVPDTIGITY